MGNGTVGIIRLRCDCDVLIIRHCFRLLLLLLYLLEGQNHEQMKDGWQHPWAQQLHSPSLHRPPVLFAVDEDSPTADADPPMVVTSSACIICAIGATSTASVGS